MQRILSIVPRPAMLVQHLDVGRTLAMMIKVGLALVIAGSLVFLMAVRAGIAPTFDQQIVLDAQHRLVIHYGASPFCVSIPNPPQHDCYRSGPEQREISMDYLTPNGAWSLLWFRLPEP
jgi:hypothetical protein